MPSQEPSMSAWRQFMRWLPASLKSDVKLRMAGLLGVPYPRYGIPAAVVARFDSTKPVSIVDVGAHEGLFTAGSEQLCGVSRALLCEPNVERADALRRTYA